MPETSIVITATDRYLSVLKSMSDVTKGFDKNAEHLERTLHELSGEKSILKAETDKARKAMQEAQKQFANTHDEADRLAASLAGQKYEDFQRKLTAVNQTMKATEKQIKSLGEAERKTKGSSGGGFGKNIVSALAISGIGDTAKQLLQDGVNTLVGSYAGNEGGTLFSNALSTAATGVSAGWMLGGVPGAILGGLAGGALGMGSGYIQNVQKKDDAFKSYVQEAYEGQVSEMDAALEGGSSIAGQREQDLIAFSKRFGGDEAAAAYLDQVKAMAVNTNYSYDEITGYSKSLLNTYDPAKTLDVLMKLSDATAGLNLDSSGVSMFINGLARMRTTGKATQEYLNYFSERGLDVYQALSDSTGADKSKIAGMVTDGKIGGAEAAEAILTYIQEQFGGLSEKLAGTYEAMVDNLGDAEANLNARMGEGYNEERKRGIEAQTDWMENDAMGEAYEALGAWKASLENAKEQYIREAVNEAMGTDEYQKAEAEGDAAAMGRIIMAAKVHGMNEYNASEGAQLALESERALADSIRNDTAGNQDYWDAGYEKGNWFTKGLSARMSEYIGTVGLGSTVSPEQMGDGDPQDWNRHAYGLKRVPFDGYPALLHRDERVLTAAEARERGSGGLQVTFSGPITVRQDSDLDELAQRLADKIELAGMRAG